MSVVFMYITLHSCEIIKIIEGNNAAYLAFVVELIRVLKACCAAFVFSVPHVE